MRKHAFLLLITAALGACTVLESNRAGAAFLREDGSARPTQIVGTYSLPRRYLAFNIKGDMETLRSSTELAIERVAAEDIIAPDPSEGFRYEINYVPSRLSRDEVDFQMDNQILKSVTVSTTDESAAALINLAEALGRVRRLGQGLGVELPAGPAATKKVGQLSLDPTDPKSVALAQNLLRGKMEMHVSPKPRPVTRLPACDHAICYRPLVSVTLTFRDIRTGNVTQHTVSVPDPHQISGVDIERSSFVERKTIYTFADGTLTTVDLNKPSEVAAAALLPIQVVDAVFKGINGAVQSLLGLQQNELTAQAELLTAQAEFLRALDSYQDEFGTRAPDDPTIPSIDPNPSLSELPAGAADPNADKTEEKEEEESSPSLGADSS